MIQTKYNPIEIEKKWQKVWDDSQSHKTAEDDSKEKYYVLEMFLYPSGKIHMGHVRNYAIGDAVARFKKAQGFNILHPMGWDAFGLPAENAAIQHKLHPNDWTIENIASMKKQLKSLGFSYDWSREINTSQPEYYKHEQAMFIDFLNTGLAYQKESIVNWDPVDHTVLANEQVIDGKGWRSGAEIEKKKLKQWFLKITDFADELLNDLDNLPHWSDNVKTMQRNWIGKSLGAEINFKVDDLDKIISAFSTRPETIFGATFICIAYDHELVKHIEPSNEKKQFIAKCKAAAGADTIDDNTPKEGWFTWHHVHHPFIKGKKLPIYIANYVLSEYGTGAVFGCPAHDARDFEFAKKYDIDIISVIKPLNSTEESIPHIEPVCTLINSGFLDGLSVVEAKQEVIKKLTSTRIGKKKTTYKLKDWGISRQRYWGCPIPIIYCKSCGTIPVPKEHLPIELPMDISFERPGNPLDHHPIWKYVKCHKCGENAIRETDTFDTFFESSWYFARFCSLEAEKAFDKDVVQKWLPVDQYIGGIEHAIMHLLYARFFTKALRNCGYLDLNEPFKGLLTQGMICHATFKNAKGDWLSPDEVIKKGNNYFTKKSNEAVTVGRIEKMSKSKKNTIDPTDMIVKYGADAVGLFLLSDSPPTRDLEWSDEGIEGSYRYLNSLYKFVSNFLQIKEKESKNADSNQEIELRKLMHQTIAVVTEDLESFALNRAIANIRKLSNELFTNDASYELTKEVIEVILKLISVFTPHIAEDLWEKLGHKESISQHAWSVPNKEFLSQDVAKVAIQINGKTRAIADLPHDCTQEEALVVIKEIKMLDKYLFNAKIKKIIHVENKIVNFVL